MKYPTFLLEKELQSINKGLKIFETMCDDYDEYERMSIIDFSHMISFFHSFVDVTHNRKEEDILFNELAVYCNDSTQYMISTIKSDYHLIRFYIQYLLRATRAFKKGVFINRKRFFNVCRKLIKVCFKQMLTEKDILYPIARYTLPDESKDKIMSQFMTLNSKLFKIKNPFKIY